MYFYCYCLENWNNSWKLFPSEHFQYVIQLMRVLFLVFLKDTNLHFSPFQTEETKYVNGKFSSKIVIAPEENVTLTCIAENELERTVTSMNVSASECPLKIISLKLQFLIKYPYITLKWKVGLHSNVDTKIFNLFVLSQAIVNPLWISRT